MKILKQRDVESESQFLLKFSQRYLELTMSIWQRWREIMEGELYYRIKRLSKEAGKSLNQIEKELNYPRNALNNYKNNANPSANRVFQLAHYFNVTPQYLMGEAEDYGDNLIQMFDTLTTYQKQQLYLMCQNWVINYIEKFMNFETNE